jgi:hypothetical protein
MNQISASGKYLFSTTGKFIYSATAKLFSPLIQNLKLTQSQCIINQIKPLLGSDLWEHTEK